ncbi:hypothetical protein ABH931_003752 [Streptacidiphilus sp. MAP12-33]|uniref:glycosyltransferase family 39 protein n=1 Tax=Streptacidiphilus sp. MAP12-33 TaxID=3156266 RepID=UPI0035139B84
MATTTSKPSASSRDRSIPVPALYRWPLLTVSVVVGVLLLSLSGRYGYHVDELYNRVSGNHLAWGYVDQPPLVALIARGETLLFGDNLTGLRVVPALLACLDVWVSGLIARELGGGRGAQVFAAVSTAGSVVTLNAGHMLTTNGPDLLSWVTLGWLFIRLLRTGDSRLWPAIGAVAGVGVLAKNLIVLLILSLLVGLLVLGPRTVLRGRHLAAGTAIAAAISAPMVAWQIAHGWPAVKMSAALTIALGADSRVAFVPFQILMIGLFLSPVWISGLVALFRRPAWRAYRSVALGYLFMSVLLVVIGGDPEYTAGLQVVLLAAGSVVAVGWARTALRRSVACGALVLNVLLSAVMMLPVLPAAWYGSNPVLKELGVSQLDQSGWPQLAREVAGVDRSLSPQDRAHAVIYANHYGLAGALDRYGPQYGLPHAYSAHNSYADYGRPADGTNVVIAVGVDRASFSALFQSCTLAGTFRISLPVADRGADFLVCRNPRESWARLWKQLTWIGVACPYTSAVVTDKSTSGCSMT